MAINVYCGVMGSGKSYEVVSGPLLDAVAAGRRVVTNVDGVSQLAIHAYLMEKRKLSPGALGEIVHVRTEDILRQGFFPIEVESSAGATVTPGFVQAGDFLVVDEAWKLWSASKRISDEHMAFFRMHRHFVHDVTGVACDVVLMIQSIGDLNRSIKAVVELSFRMVKLKTLGLSTRYRVEMYETSKQSKSTRTGTFVRKYQAEIFPLYKSYAGGAGKEVSVDKRQNVLARGWIWVVAVLCVIALPAALYLTWRFFHPANKGHSGVHAVAGPATASGPVPAAPSGPVMSDSWRVVGGYRADGLSWVVLADASGRLRVASPSEFMGGGIARVGVVDGQRVATWSGALHAVLAQPVPVVPK